MARCYEELIEVRRRDEVPAAFLWRRRLYVVREVLGRWTETSAWWQSDIARALYAGDDTAGDTGQAAVTTLSVDDGERDMWRVEASAGRFLGSGVYDLCFAWSAGSWTLVRALD